MEGRLFGPRVEKLVVGSSSRPRLVEGVQWQIGKVRDALAAAGYGDVPVRGTLCFLDADWPLFGGQFDVSGIAVRWPKALADDLVGPGPLDAEQVDRVHHVLAKAFPMA